MVLYDIIEDMPGRLCKNISEESVKKINSQLEKKDVEDLNFTILSSLIKPFDRIVHQFTI